MPARRRLLLATWATAAGAVVAGLGGLGLLRTLAPPPPVPASHGGLMLAPMVSVVEPCLQAPAPPGQDSTGWSPGCTGPQGSAAALVEESLRALETRAYTNFPVGYTLPVPLLSLFQPRGDDWALDTVQIDRIARTVADNQRPLILYLFSTHFSTGAPIEAALATDPANLSVTRDGPMSAGSYYGATLYNWSFASIDNSLTQRRAQAITGVLDAICRLPAAARARVQGVTLLGELHHLFPDFEAGMGFEAPYRVSDYSPASEDGFRRFLRARFGGIAALNQAVGGNYPGFEDVRAPSRDIRSEALARYTEHIDAFAHGLLPVSGWVHAPAEARPWIRIHRNGSLVARTRVGLGRQDVLAARPAFGHADVGWRWDMDFRRLPIGLHRIDVMLERPDAAPALLATRHIAVMDPRQRTPPPVAQAPLPLHTDAPPGVDFHLDQPRDQASYYYNPLVPLWHAFRAQQVVDYLRHVDRLVAGSCLGGTPRYTHQIVPFSNPGWDAHKFAIGASLQPDSGLALGVSLYGEPSYGDSFLQWHARHGGGRGYGITEFHPLRAMDAEELRRTLARHAAQGARFLSFFLEPRWHGERVPRSHNLFSFDPDNPRFGSDVLYRSVQQVLAPAQP